MDDLLARITFNKDVLGGKPKIARFADIGSYDIGTQSLGGNNTRNYRRLSRIRTRGSECGFALRSPFGCPRREGRIIVTTDKDFEQLIWQQEMPHCGVLRLENLPRIERKALLEDVLKLYSQELIDGAIVIALKQVPEPVQAPPPLRNGSPIAPLLKPTVRFWQLRTSSLHFYHYPINL